MKADKKLNANVDFYSASTYHTLGIDVDLFTPVFAVSRISGWSAHVIEQLDDNRLIRPRADYVGPIYPAKYIPWTSDSVLQNPRVDKWRLRHAAPFLTDVKRVVTRGSSPEVTTHLRRLG